MNFGGAKETNILEPVSSRPSFFSHVISTTEEGKAEVLNVTQYALLGIIPVVLLNKLIQRFLPDADPDKSSLEIVIEVLVQLIVMFVGIILIHRVITFIPTYSEFKYESLSLTNVILAFMILVLSIQTKIGIKVNILADRTMELWTGRSRENMESARKSDKQQSAPPPQMMPDMLMAPQSTTTQNSNDIRESMQSPTMYRPPTMDVMGVGANFGGVGSAF